MRGPVSGPFLTYKRGGGCLPYAPPKQKVSFRLYPLSLFNKIDLNCYVFLPLSNDKLLLIIFIFCAFFPSFISNTSILSINFRANLNAQNAGNGISRLQMSGGVCPTDIH